MSGEGAELFQVCDDLEMKLNGSVEMKQENDSYFVTFCSFKTVGVVNQFKNAF